MWSLTSLRTKRISGFRKFRLLPPKTFLTASTRSRLSRHPVRWPTGTVCDQMNRLKIVPTGNRMRRREFLKLSGVAAIAFPWPAFAQKDLPLVAVLVPGTADLARQRIDAVRKGT